MSIVNVTLDAIHYIIMKRVYIYVVGFGDNLNPVRKVLLWSWKLRGKSYELIAMRWTDHNETYQEKQKRILSVMEKYAGRDIVLVGESAGGAMVLSMLARYGSNIHSVVTVCGFNHTVSAVHSIHKNLHPAFIPLVKYNDSHFPTIRKFASNITNIYSLRDGVIDPKYSKVEDAHHKAISIPVHQLSIAFIVLRFFRYIQER